jgi:nucleoid-associated protein YgaU
LPVTAKPVRFDSESKRPSVDWTQPEPWIVAVLLATGVAVIARHPIAHAIGTEADDTAMTPSVVATAPAVAGPAPSAAAAAVAPVPTHAPRNPFRALVDASGALVAPSLAGAAASVGTTVTTKTSHPTSVSKPAAVAGSATCAGTVHTVVAGDSLWSLAATMVKSNDTGKINVVWHRIYEANTPPLGSNPSLLPVGTKLCLPSKG